jgi:hypothetical protein
MLRCSKSSDSRSGLSYLAAFAAFGGQIAGLEIGNPGLCPTVFNPAATPDRRCLPE